MKDNRKQYTLDYMIFSLNAWSKTSLWMLEKHETILKILGLNIF